MGLDRRSDATPEPHKHAMMSLLRRCLVDTPLQHTSHWCVCVCVCVTEDDGMCAQATTVAATMPERKGVSDPPDFNRMLPFPSSFSFLLGSLF